MQCASEDSFLIRTQNGKASFCALLFLCILQVVDRLKEKPRQNPSSLISTKVNQNSLPIPPEFTFAGWPQNTWQVAVYFSLPSIMVTSAQQSYTVHAVSIYIIFKRDLLFVQTKSCLQGRVEDSLAPLSLETSRMKSLYNLLQTHFKANEYFLSMFLFPVDPSVKFICDNRDSSAT